MFFGFDDLVFALLAHLVCLYLYYIIYSPKKQAIMRVSACFSKKKRADSVITASPFYADLLGYIGCFFRIIPPFSQPVPPVKKMLSRCAGEHFS